VETGTVKEVIGAPRHPYTAGLMGSVPSNNPRGQPLRQIPGMTPSLANLPVGCPFRTRCERASARCEQVPQEESISATHCICCFNPVPVMQMIGKSPDTVSRPVSHGVDT